MAVARKPINNSNASERADEVFNNLNENKRSLSDEMNLVQLTIRLDKEAIKKLSAIAKEMGLGKSAAVRYAVNRFIKEHSSCI